MAHELKRLFDMIIEPLAVVIIIFGLTLTGIMLYVGYIWEVIG